MVNVGDRVFFESDQSTLTPQARATLDNQAQWLQPLFAILLHRRRSRRRARHPRIQYRARRPPRPDRARISCLPRRKPAAHAHDLLRQGTSGRGLRRHLLLVAESPLGHRAERELVAAYCHFNRRIAPVCFEPASFQLRAPVPSFSRLPKFPRHGIVPVSCAWFEIPLWIASSLLQPSRRLRGAEPLCAAAAAAGRGRQAARGKRHRLSGRDRHARGRQYGRPRGAHSGLRAGRSSTRTARSSRRARRCS